MVEFLPFYFFLFVTFPTFQCRYVYQYLKISVLFQDEITCIIKVKCRFS